MANLRPPGVLPGLVFKKNYELLMADPGSLKQHINTINIFSYFFIPFS